MSLLRRLSGLAVAAIGLMAVRVAAAEPVTYWLQPEHTRVHWEVRHFGTSTQRGWFTDVAGSVRLDRSARRGDVSISIGTASVSSGVRLLDSMLRGTTFLASADHPQAYFVGSDLRFDGDRLSAVRGEFTLRGVSAPLTLRALNFACRVDDDSKREVCGGDFEAEFRHAEFGTTLGFPFVGDKVRLLITIEGVRE